MGETRIPELVGDPLNPDTHRAAIVALDAVLFEDGPLAEGDREQVARTLVELSEVASVDPSNTIAVIHGKEMKTLAAMAQRTKVGTPLLNSQLRHQWLRIRSSLFDDAWWFRRSSADPIVGATPDPPPPSALRPATAEERGGLEQTLFSLQAIAVKARRDLPNGYDSEPHRQFVAETGRELALNEARLGPPPPKWGVDVFYTDAYRHAAEALRVTKVLAGLGTGAPTSSREYLIRKAEEHVGKARQLVLQMR